VKANIEGVIYTYGTKWLAVIKLKIIVYAVKMPMICAVYSCSICSNWGKRAALGPENKLKRRS